MGDGRGQVTECETEEKTELVSLTSSEYASRLHRLYVQEAFSTSELGGEVHLDELVVPPDKGIRLLVRPLRSRSVSPGSRDSCEWIALRAEVSAADQPQETVLAVTQTSKDIKFVVRMPGEHDGDGLPMPPLWFELYYDPESDDQILLNNSETPIALSRVSQPARAESDGPGSPGTPGTQSPEYTINPGTIKALSPGTWRIRIGSTEVLDFRILERRRAVHKAPPPRISKETGMVEAELGVHSSGKRSFVADEDDELGPGARRQKTADGSSAVGDKDKEAIIMFLHPAERHPMLEMQREDTVVMAGGCDMDTYKLTKRDPIASTSLSAVFTGTMEHPDVPTGSVITVKVIKTRPAAATGVDMVGAVVRAQETERNVIRQADTWLREYKSHEYLRHNSIVRLYGGDARHLSLYMEHVDGRDLSKKGVWRASNSDYFTGNRQDAARILRDIAGALHYVHGRSLVHNDVKPANILYSRERGAVLCDFGLSTSAEQPASAGGTPYYVPPEFIGRKLRGPPSDVWALGITMLYVLRKISFPDSRGHHRARPLYWMIADVNKAPGHHGHGGGVKAGGSAANGPSAVAQMQTWLSEVIEAKEKLSLEDTVERLTYEMLIPNQHQRITMKRVVAELFKDSSTG
ncbi:serine/threonine-protein kinase [Grosmannia clavigera kw1407]|uniref:Serine/threonine-protein kinase n=1 Tax=Grosmannia clavigera (strain kw1407 / UAMH 11150) TaxID=655863 RepID=F0XCI4_GROCL|nr:serine/threonine-protein kinase [Grosmannia clavigera kw1407]EFX03868.1 serine/threonine-protein kinase [Grosmannia clavigera kw1407]